MKEEIEKTEKILNQILRDKKVELNNLIEEQIKDFKTEVGVELNDIENLNTKKEKEILENFNNSKARDMILALEELPIKKENE
jgi:hypothetical protein